jgi:hypothetical protein
VVSAQHALFYILESPKEEPIREREEVPHLTLLAG